ncbi:M23 family metallopeptidase [Lacisediminihabitans profunda]|uniref:Peptidoglycan DD-metalloendopeptidase family protein n=1 Tax=Lacisediminihabitans profunda TaxID=2594790 RepID=A0A5C8UR67_9MICO|nr:M23 family metallopeptidase [Lacisediminihabitans profunda]TXN30387.1 peptidoglycan DD-metalloendopeptidase family protein [Lacisediminihabitans profunda]
MKSISRVADRVALVPRSRARRSLAVVAVLSVLVSGTILGSTGSAAWAQDYPSWTDVQNARNNVTAKKAEIARLQALLAALEAAVTTTQAVAEQKGAEAQVAQQNYDEAAQKAAQLQSQADAAQAKATKSKQQAGQLAAKLARSGGTDLSATLFFSGSKANDLLSQLGLASMVKDQSAGLYEKAIQDQNSAQALTDQANVAKAALKLLADAAQKALDEAAAAAEAAATAFTEQQDNKARLDAQLATLVENVDHTEAEYVAGIKAMWGASAGLGAGQISLSGWARPAGGHITSSYGNRLDPYTHNYALHSGTDLGASCGSPIFAAHTGTVSYAGPYGGYGNYIRIDNGDGTGTGYGHIVNGGILVRVGQGVGVGQNIAKVGSTGWSTGCHLHFEVYRGGTTTDPVPFMRGQGIELAN